MASHPPKTRRAQAPLVYKAGLEDPHRRGARQLKEARSREELGRMLQEYAFAADVQSPLRPPASHRAARARRAQRARGDRAARTACCSSHARGGGG